MISLLSRGFVTLDAGIEIRGIMDTDIGINFGIHNHRLRMSRTCSVSLGT